MSSTVHQYDHVLRRSSVFEANGQHWKGRSKGHGRSRLGSMVILCNENALCRSMWILCINLIATRLRRSQPLSHAVLSFFFGSPCSDI